MTTHSTEMSSAAARCGRVLAILAAFLVIAQSQPPGKKGAEAIRREALVRSARSMIGKTKIKVRGKNFASDCSGTVMAICWEAGLDLGRAMAGAKGSSGVARMHDSLSRARLLSGKGERPRPGDVLFWNDTYDKNGNGKADDPLTHIGIVVSEGKAGQFSYIHYRYDKGVVEELMNLDFPSVKDSPSGDRLNSNVRMSSWKPDARRLAGELFRDSGSVAGLKEGWAGES